jgi:hypothetical protein
MSVSAAREAMEHESKAIAINMRMTLPANMMLLNEACAVSLFDDDIADESAIGVKIFVGN